MAIRDLIPWWGGREVAAKADEADDPFVALQREMDRAFGNFRRAFEGGLPVPGFGSGAGAGFGLDRWGAGAEVTETDHGLEVRVELPGLEEKDIDVSVASGVLTVKADRTEERKAEGGFTSRSSRSFRRSVALPPDVEHEKAEARFKNGLLTVILPRTGEAAASAKRIAVQRG